jgi:peptidoglycan-N-acetylglucosamine deacetylase
MYLVKTPNWLQSYFKDYTWKINTQEKVLYLTFDDGPIPEVTPWVLEQLAKYEAKATFFCVGENVQKYPEIYQSLLKNGHSVGNHTQNHLNGWSTNNAIYAQNIEKCAQNVESTLFRPPYGRLKPAQSTALRPQYRIVMWDVLSGDFDSKISNQKCLENVLQYATNGSIIVMHDSLKAEEKLRFILPRVLKHFASLGFRFERIVA